MTHDHYQGSKVISPFMAQRSAFIDIKQRDTL